MHVTPEFFALCVVALVAGLDRFGLLDRWKKKSAADAAAELAIAGETIRRIRAERNQAIEVARKLEQTRSLEPVLEQLHANAELQAQVLDRLVHHNGSFAHMEEALSTMGEGLKLVTGFIAGVVDLPVKHPSRGGS